MKITFNVSGMKCGGCSANVVKALENQPGCDSVQVDLDSATVIVEGDIDTTEITALISKAGYPASVAE